jgi:ABC-type multidrug transport system fused ATPase/permease subunit
MLPNSIDIVLSTKIALDRLKGYLNQAEVDVNKTDVSDGRILLDDATFSWPRADSHADSGIPAFQMSHYSLAIPQGKLTLVCGPLGSGKTLFVS